MIFSITNPPFGFYVYLYLREDGTPYYVGKGKDKRAWAKHNLNIPNDERRIIFVATKLLEHEAFILEIRLIQMYGRKDIKTGILRNITDGGEGTSGWVPTDENKKNISESKIGTNKGLTYEEIYGEEKAKELRKRRSESMSKTRKKQVSESKPNPMLGKKQSQSVIDAIKLARKKSIGKFFWITDGTNSKKHPVSEPIPEGFRKGRDALFLLKH